MSDISEQSGQISVKAPEDSLSPLRLEDLSLPMQQACARAGWGQLMPVQAHALPYLLQGRHMMIQSRTGSGKTGAYLLPLLQCLHNNVSAVQALILVPTRELASQVQHEASVLLKDSGMCAVAVYGGVGYAKQLEALRGGAQVVVGTPGRVLDHLLRRTLSLENLKVLVFDEADRMLSIGFYPDMKEIQRYLPRRPILSTLFSATYPPHVLNLAGEFLNNPSMLSLSQNSVHIAEMQHLFCQCLPMDKDRTLVRLLETENPASAIIFCNTKSNVHYVAEVLKGFGYNADELSADLSQSRREDVLARLRQGKVRLLVATDVAARGIDIPALSHVFLYEPPEDRESYIHRAGRTGRAGAAGTVISLVDVMQKMELERIAKFYKINITQLSTPADTDVAKVVGLRALALLEAQRRACTGLQLERARRFAALAKELAQSEEDDQNVLLALLLDGLYQASLGTPNLPSKSQLSSSPSSFGPSTSQGSQGRQNDQGGQSRNKKKKRNNSGRSEELLALAPRSSHTSSVQQEESQARPSQSPEAAAGEALLEAKPARPSRNRPPRVQDAAASGQPAGTQEQLDRADAQGKAPRRPRTKKAAPKAEEFPE